MNIIVMMLAKYQNLRSLLDAERQTPEFKTVEDGLSSTKYIKRVDANPDQQVRRQQSQRQKQMNIFDRLRLRN